MPSCAGHSFSPLRIPHALSLSLFTNEETETQREVAFPGLSHREQQG